MTIYNLAQMITSTTGTGTLVLDSAAPGALSFDDAGVPDGETVSYAITDGLNREVGTGVYTTATKQLTRNVLTSTDSNNAIDLSGNATVYITPNADDFGGQSSPVPYVSDDPPPTPSDGELWWDTDDNTTLSFGSSVIRGPFIINYDDAGLNDGIAFYTPTIGDILLDFFYVVDEIWDGTTPRLDIGTGVDSSDGVFAAFGGSFGYIEDINAIDSSPAGEGLSMAKDIPGVTGYSMTALLWANGRAQILVTAANPLKVWISQDGTAGGADPGATQGSLRLYIITATPIPF